jgi:hypothetical protein
MEFLKQNWLNTSTQIAVTSNTSLASNLFIRDKFRQYYSNGFADDNTSSSITITFDSTTPVSRIGLVDMNFKEFYMFYNGATANSFPILTADTTTISYTGNADLNKYFRFNTIQCTSVTLVAKKTITANQEKLLGLFVLSDLQVELEKIPSANNYKPKLVPKQIVHTLSDGGTRVHTIRKKWDTAFTLNYVSPTQRDSLADLHDSDVPFNFVPFGTATGWDAILFETVWVGPFEFFEYSDNAAASGYSGKIALKETPT